jgi:hypothetical protein
MILTLGSATQLHFCYKDSSVVPAGQYDFAGAVAHEITEVMGRELGVGQTIGSRKVSFRSTYSIILQMSQAGLAGASRRKLWPSMR